jgi:hypothetical protein
VSCHDEKRLGDYARGHAKEDHGNRFCPPGNSLSGCWHRFADLFACEFGLIRAGVISAKSQSAWHAGLLGARRAALTQVSASITRCGARGPKSIPIANGNVDARSGSGISKSGASNGTFSPWSSLT